MAWAVDTCVLIDVLEADPDHGRRSAALLSRKLREGLVDWRQPWTWQDTIAAHRAWEAHVAGRRARSAPRRPIADVLIGAFAGRFDGLVTRNAKDFRRVFPSLPIAEPGRP